MNKITFWFFGDRNAANAGFFLKLRAVQKTKQNRIKSKVQLKKQTTIFLTRNPKNTQGKTLK